LLGVWFSTVATLDLASIAGIIAAVGTGVDDQIIITDESGRNKIRDWSKRLKRAFFVIFTSAASTIGAMVPLVSPELSTLAVGAAGLGLIGYTLQGRGKNPHYLAIGGLALAVSVIGLGLSPSAFALQAVQGFAITTILGILVGITITRPAYAKILEHLKD
jgi:preprotein translocase subunit SecD